MAIKSFPTLAAHSAATLSTIESTVSLIENSNEIIVDGVNVVTTSPTVGDAIFLNESNQIVFIKGGDAIQKAIIPSAWTWVGTVFRRAGRQVWIVNKSGSDVAYAGCVQFRVTIPAESGDLTMGACFVTAGTVTSITVAYDSTQPLATVKNTYEENTDTLVGKINTALAALTLRGTWWAYQNDDDEIILQRDSWSDYRDYTCNGALTHVTWGDMPASTRYFKNNGKYSEYRGLMNIARGAAYWSTNGVTPSATVQLGAAGDASPVTKSAFESSEYCNLLRAAYSTYNDYLYAEFGVKYPQKYGTFALGGVALAEKYGPMTVPTKSGSTRGKYLAMNTCYNVNYNNAALATGKWHLPTSEEGCHLLADETLAAIRPTISKMSGTTINNSTHRWFVERYNVSYARTFNGNYGGLIYNYVNLAYRTQAVTLLNI